MSDPHDRRLDDRMGLGAFDAVDAPDQWDDITRRAEGAELGSSWQVGKRRSPSTWFMAAAAVALVAVAAVAVSVRSGDDSAPTPATTPDETLPSPDTEPPSTEPPSTEPATTESVSTLSEPVETTPTTSPTPTTDGFGVAATAWEPDCVDRLGASAARFDAGPNAAGFTTLGSEPSLDIGVPVVDADSGPVTPYLQTTVVPDGVALAMHEFADGAEVLAVVVVDDDGSIRWRRCLEGVGWVTALIPAGSELWVAAEADTTSLRAFDLATGADFAAPFTVGDRVAQDVSGQRLLVGKSSTSPVLEPSDRLGVVDLDQFTATDIPYPDPAIGDTPDAFRYELVDTDDEVLVAGTSMSSSTPDLVWTGDSWSSDPVDLRRLPPTLVLPFGSGEPLRLLDGAGDLLWEVDGFHTISREGFNSAIAGSVVLAMECLDWTEDLGCQWTDENTPPREQLSAFDRSTGERLWARPGGQAFAAIDGERGIVTAEEGWELVDLRTGERVDDEPVTAWPQDDIFANECCGAGDYVWTRLDGGVLFESTGDRLRVWLPPEASTTTITTDAFS